MSELLFWVPATILCLTAVALVYLEFRRHHAPGEHRTRIEFGLSEAQSERLRYEANRLGIAPAALAAGVMTNLLAGDFETAVTNWLRTKADSARHPAHG